MSKFARDCSWPPRSLDLQALTRSFSGLPARNSETKSPTAFDNGVVTSLQSSPVCPPPPLPTPLPLRAESVSRLASRTQLARRLGRVCCFAYSPAHPDRLTEEADWRAHSCRLVRILRVPFLTFGDCLAGCRLVRPAASFPRSHPNSFLPPAREGESERTISPRILNKQFE